MRARHAVAASSLALLLVASACSSPADDAGSGAAGGDRATVAWVVDGDTVRLADGSLVRLVQVDAPERGDCFGTEATRVLVSLTPKGSRVRLERDPALDDEDAYGRLLRYLLVGGRNVNVELVERGAASPYFFRGERGRHADELDAAVSVARAARRGYWGACPRARLEPGLGSVTGPASTRRR